jgi:hypothetical protein
MTTPTTEMPQDRIDPNIALPPAIRAAAERADQLLKLANGTAEPAAPEGGDPTPEGNPEPAPAQQSAPPPPAQGDESWERKYHSVRGNLDRIRGENQQLAQINQQLSDRLSNLESMLSSLQKNPIQQPTPHELRASSLIKPEEREEYGDELLDLIGRRAQEVAAPLQAEIQRLNAQLNATGKAVQAQTKQQMHAELDAQVPNWREINTNDDFLTWLQLPDPYSGAIRQTLLKQAYEQNETPRVANFFQGFLRERAAVAPAGAGPQPGSGGKPSPKMDLKDLAAPGRAKSAAGSTPADEPIFKQSDISAFYSAKAAGKFRGREAEADKLEAAIFDAQRKGRIVPG